MAKICIFPWAAQLLAQTAMGKNWIFVWGTQLLWQAPTLLVYVGGIIACALFRRRAPAAAAWTFAGLILLFLSSIGFPLIQTWIVASGATATSIGATLSILGLAFSVSRGAGIALLLVGVFTGRESVSGGFEISPNPPPLRY